jgi:hypothetical protein
MKRNKPDLDRLKECFSYDPLTGEFRHSLRRQGVKFGAIAGRLDKDGYRMLKMDYVVYRAHLCAWYIMTGVWPEIEIDHKNGKTGENIFTNLREATRSQQGANTAHRKTSRSKFKGVTLVRYGKDKFKYRACISCMGNRTYIGWYDKEEDAGKAYMTEARRLFGEFASNRFAAS